MKIELTDLPGVLVLEPIIWKDDRGYFYEQYNKFEFDEHGIKFHIIQVNQVYSAYKGILRGIGFQNNPYSQSKLVSCVSGEIMDTVLKDTAEQLKDEQARILSGAPSDGIRSLAKEPTTFRHIKKLPDRRLIPAIRVFYQWRC